MLKIENLHVEVEGKPILKGIDLEVKAGEVHAIMGPNGSGKSTLSYVLAGREGYDVTAGKVTFEGQDLLAMAPEERAHRVARFCARMASVWRNLFDLTVPFLSWFTGAYLNRCVARALPGGRRYDLEDSWVPFFCISTSLSEFRARVHRRGPAWRYIRASMSLSGIVPPIFDWDPGRARWRMLVDGGYVNNVPIEPMHTVWAGGPDAAVGVPRLDSNPELVNEDPYGEGWMIKMKLKNAGDGASLMDAAAYEQLVGS